ncbi:MAG: TetR/AcrR family transcriptional regulator [Sutterella sp.]|nr:TetR/AcrR family transcriptional regulator [Sutterella sp.]
MAAHIGHIKELPAKRGRQDDRAQERREEILAGARRCFLNIGFHRTTLRDIAQELEMSVGHIYNYFESKEAIIEAMVRRETEQFLAMLREDTSWTTNEPSAVRRHFERVVDAFLDRESAYLAISFMDEALSNERIYDLTVSVSKEFRQQILGLCEKTNHSAPREQWETQVIFMRSVLEGLRMAVLFNPEVDKDQLREVAVDRLLLLAQANRQGSLKG